MFKPKNLRILVIILVLITLAVSVNAELPNYINYQGRLVDDAGNPITGSKLMKFTIYGSADGDDDFWSSDFQTVQINNGLFEYTLGSHISLPQNLFTGDSPRYLGITVNTDEEITPRTLFITVPYTLHALKADTSTYVLGGPGVATVVSPSWVQLGTTYGPVDSISINIPGDGVVIVTATGTLRIDPATNSEYLLCSISQSRTSQSSNCAYYYDVPGFITGRSYFQPLSLTYVDNVTAGAGKYYLGGISDATYNGFVAWLTMTAVYYPTVYGDNEETE